MASPMKERAILSKAYEMTIGDLYEFYCLSCLPHETQRRELANFRCKWDFTNGELLVLYKVVEFLFEDSEQYLENVDARNIEDL